MDAKAASDTRAALQGIRDRVTAKVERAKSFIPDYAAKVTQEAREEALKAAEPHVQRTVLLRQQLDAAKAGQDPARLARTARFHEDPALDATASLSWQGRLSRADELGLVEFAEDAVHTGNAALARLIVEEAQSRKGLPADRLEQLRQLASRVPVGDPKAREALDRAELDVFEAEQLAAEIRGEQRDYTAAQYEQMGFEEFKRVRRAQQQGRS